jgi:predicted enzyme related to lactoylglutathione lyase
MELQGGQRYRLRMARVTGIGGVFFKASSEDRALATWYAENLGIALDPKFGGAILRWPDDHAEDKGLTVWHVAGKDSQWFSPSRSAFMINYRVDDMAGMIARLQANGVEVIQGPESHQNGTFAWIMDPDGNKVELWEPKLWNEGNKEQP